MLKKISALFLVLALLATPAVVQARGGAGGGGGGGGGGGVKLPSNARVAGYITAIDFANKRIAVGQSYYGSGILQVVSLTKVDVNAVNAAFADLRVGDFAEVKYDSTTRIAAQIEATR